MKTCICFGGTPDWNAITAVSTAVLALGVVIAWRQLRHQGKIARIVETRNLLIDWDHQNEARARLDADADSYNNDRIRVQRLYNRLCRLSGFRHFREAFRAVDDFIEDTARAAERIEVYIRRGAADEGIVAEHIGYDVLSTYYILQDVLQRRAIRDDWSYEGFRDLALRIQDYARIHPLDADLRGLLVWSDLPNILYYGGDQSKGYKKSIWRRLELLYVDAIHSLFPHSQYAKERRDLNE